MPKKATGKRSKLCVERTRRLLKTDLGALARQLHSYLTVRTHVYYMNTMDFSAAKMVLRDKAGLKVFSTNTALKEMPDGRRHAARVITAFSLQVVSPKHDRYSAATTVPHSGSKDSHPPGEGKIAAFEVPRPSRSGAFASMIYLPREVALSELERAQNSEGSA